ncbi:probable RNA-directed DNA polymerase from transposon BS [Trichonephila clavipes]|uniref:Probable RNA-directed DNA polymerase from transposon BS n=1 Tax=Trichonephila clavipes TaxID=2585209 RepID=A0A8X6WCQ7_TRICX|nr:probable RNA-directed DNA polymerase from transposon BS [Trichonephila clavipes]
MLNFNIATPIHKDNPRAITTCWSAFRKNLKNEIKLFDYAKINSESTLEEKVAKFADAIFSTPPSSPISPTDPDEICDYMKKLKNSKAPGIDNITNKMIKNFPFKIILIFTYIINKILLLRHFPTEWKVAIVFPIHKPGKNKNSPDAYRPISLLSSLSKIAEHIILNRIKNHIYSTNFLNPNQFGFTQQLSTYHPLLRLTEKISSGFQRGRTTGAVFLDIQKAFDRVWIDGLIYKLITYNFPPAIIHILYSYLTNRKYKVRVNDTLSITHRVNIGVTQGSLLGPVLFNINVNDIPSHPRTMINLYADDTAISATYKNTKSVTIALNKHLALLEKYFNDWKIKINVDKTVAVLFTKARKPIAPPTLYSTPLRWSQTTKYLGITFDKTLAWKPHILYARDKFRIALKKLYPLICRNSNMYLYNKVLLYTAVLRPILSYGCPIWGYAANTNIKILETAQNSIIRCIEIFNLSPTTFCTTFGTAIREDSHFLLTSNRSALFHTTGSTTTERPSIKTDSPLLYEMTSLLRTSASPPMSPHQSSCSNHTAKESTAPREPQRTLKTLYYFTQDSKRTHD